VNPPVIESRGPLPISVDEAKLPSGTPIPITVTPDGWGVSFVDNSAPDPAKETCSAELELTSPEGAVGRPGVFTRCAVGIDSNTVNERWILWIDAPAPELEIGEGWRLMVYDRQSGDVSELTEPNRARIPIESIWLEGDVAAWHEFEAPDDPSVSTGWNSYVINLSSGRRLSLGDGVINPIVRDPWIFASRLAPGSRESRLAKFRLDDGAAEEWIDVLGSPLTASSTYVLVLTGGDGVLIDFDGRPVASFEGTLLFPVASEQLMTWSVPPDAMTTQIQLLDTRCLALYDVGDLETQGVSASVAGDVLSWTGREGAPMEIGSGEYFQVDLARHDLCDDIAGP
jgi:hypothetical protein